jgi:hypothetical protein
MAGTVCDMATTTQLNVDETWFQRLSAFAFGELLD